MNGIWANTSEPDSAPPGFRSEVPRESGGGVLSEAAAAGTLIEQFERICVSHGDRIAATCGPEDITYHALNSAANQFARALLDLGLGRKRGNDTIVAICLDRSIAMIGAMLGVLKAGCAYLPLDPTYPAARIAQTLEDAAPAAIITDTRLAARLPQLEMNVLLADRPMPAAGSIPPSPATAESLAYVMYTSGSTGKPKGVLVTHRNVMRLFTETDRWFRFDENDVWTMFHSFAFDFSVWEIWGPLLTGGRLVIVPFEISRSTEEFYALLSEQRVTVLNQTPSAFSLICNLEDTQSAPALPLELRVVIFGGEALQYRALRNWFKRHGDRKTLLINMYGITETTVHVTYRVVTEADAHVETDSLIGEPIPDLQIHLLDSNLNPVPEGEEGELCIGGAGVARGYLNRPELTAQRFIADPFSRGGGLLYRSGDLGRRRADGELVYLGRNDHQVKINGFRIELGEVEAAIAGYPGIRQVCVTAPADHTGRQRLAAYFVCDTQVPTHALSVFLAERTPPQMVPSFYRQMESLPLTHNGKVDRAALPEPVTGSLSPAGGKGTPMQERVAALWRGVLETPNVDLDDNFFDIGGTSILLIRVRTELQTQLGRQIPITWMFEFTTIRTLADKLRDAEADSSDPGLPASGAVLGAAQAQARRQREAFARMRTAKGGRS